MPFVYEVDADGFIVNDYMSELLEEIPDDFITVQVPQGAFYRSKWTGEEWIEGATPEEIEEMKKPLPVSPSEFDKLRMEQAQANAELVELIFGMSGGGV